MMRILGRGYQVAQRAMMRKQDNRVLQEQLAGAHILLVEDNELNQELASELLQSAAITVSLAENGLQAVEMSRDNDFDGILMDIQMPVMDGYTATAKIREFKPDIAIIAMTANAMAGDREKVIDSGMNDYISKPINVEKMFSTLSKWISPANASIYTQATKTLPLSEGDAGGEIDFSFTVINPEIGLAICNGSIKLYKKLLRKFIDGQTDFESTFREELLALHWKDATRIAHTLKGNAGNLGAVQLQAKAAKLEHSCGIHADADIIESELKQVCVSLQQTFDDISLMFSTEVNEGHAPSMLESSNKYVELQPQLLQVAQLIKGFDTAATDLLYELIEEIKDPVIVGQLDAIIQVLESYDFAGASVQLEKLL